MCRPINKFSFTFNVSDDELSPVKSAKFQSVESVRVDPSEFQHKDMSRDVEEGRTLFLTRLAIDTSEFSVKTMLSAFGELKYVMIVKDKLSEQSKGTAFAQFVVSHENFVFLPPKIVF